MIPARWIFTRAGDQQVGQSIQPVDVVENHGFEVVGGALALADFLLEFLVDLGAVGALGFDQPVFGIEEDLAVCLPDAVAAHPLPLVPGVVLGEVHNHGGRLEIHEAALDEDLHGDVGLDNARGHLARGHLHVDEEVVEQAVRIAVDEIAGAIALGDEIGLQRRRAAVADGIHKRGGKRQPSVVVGLLGLESAQGAGRQAFGADLVWRDSAPAHDLRAGSLGDRRPTRGRRGGGTLLAARDGPDGVVGAAHSGYKENLGADVDVEVR